MIDISWPLTEDMTRYKERKLFHTRFFRVFSKDNARQSLAAMDSHAGTHIDAPAHYVKNGKTIDKVKLEIFNGRCRVLDLSKLNVIGKDNLVKFKIKAGERILLKTKNSDLKANAKFNYDFVYLDASGGEYLASKKVKCVGIDYLGIERNQKGHETHGALLGNEIPIIEGLRLKGVKPGKYELVCLPLSYVGMEAAPCRAVLR
tara:strand:+ start:52362 stop:52970 length:609 start_codon:yes stop_codon:yes gene_type:complete